MNLGTYCNCENIIDKPKHILETHIKDILSKDIQSVFKRQTKQHPTLAKQPTRYKADSELHEEQLWKSGQTTSTLEFILQKANPTELQENLHLLIPPVLIILDDYDVQYKILGVKMVHLLITRMSSTFIIKSHLDNVFLESLFHCLYYLSQERDLELLEVTYPCLLHLISNMKKGHTKYVFYERVLIDGIATGLLHAGRKIQTLLVLLKHIPVLFHGLGSVGVQYLKVVIPPLCESISIQSNNNNPDMKLLITIAVDGLVAVIQECWPR
ncbi:unnamed protein product [Rhizopus stolonifer]